MQILKNGLALKQKNNLLQQNTALLMVWEVQALRLINPFNYFLANAFSPNNSTPTFSQ